MGDDDALDSEQQTGDELHVSVATLRRWRRQQLCPVPTHIGRNIFYRRGAKREWLRQQEGFKREVA
jgi:hypothetical protein